MVVPAVGIEPTRLSSLDFESNVFTDFTTQAGSLAILKCNYAKKNLNVFINEYFFHDFI